jgi:hypothetical protein
MVKHFVRMKEVLRRQYWQPFSPSFYASLLDVTAGNCQRALVNESGMTVRAPNNSNSGINHVVKEECG